MPSIPITTKMHKINEMLRHLVKTSAQKHVGHVWDVKRGPHGFNTIAGHA